MHERKAPLGKISEIFFLDTLSSTLNEKILNIIMTFFYTIRALFSTLKKGQERPPLPPSYASEPPKFICVVMLF